MKKNIAILCSGGDVSGMNPCIKQFVDYSIKRNLSPFFIYDGYDGLIDNNISSASHKDVSRIISTGGTKIRSSRSKRFKEKKYRKLAYNNLKTLDINMLVVLGGDGSFRGMSRFSKEHNINFCGVPSTIDNDINLTDYCLGVDTALNIIKNSIDSIRDTIASCGRAFVIETMGRNNGYLALVSHLTSGSELCLIPEKEYKLSDYEEDFKKQIKNGRRYFIAIISEGVKQDASEIANWFEKKIGIDARISILGHIQRGGNPSVYDRLMAYKWASFAVDNLIKDNIQSIACYTNNKFELKNIEEIVSKTKVLDKELLSFLD